MSPTCAEALNAIKSSASMSLIYGLKAELHLNDASDHWNLYEFPEAIYDLILAGRDTTIAAKYAGYGFDPFAYKGPTWWYLTECIGEPNMEGIINAMLEAEAEEIKHFVGLVDAYRQSVWDKPFNQEFYAALARGFD